MSRSDLHTAWSRLLLRAFACAGVTEVVISPGSRSTPLALAAWREEGLRCHVSIDERAAAFFALGQARLTGRPSVLLCTSGTAAAHYLPAIIEARLVGLPLIALTADRPWEAYDAGASQTIDQVKLFGGEVNHYAELGLPDPSPEALRAVPRLAAQAVHAARWPVPGPVHVNARFRKPLEPVDAGPEPWSEELARLTALGAPQVFASSTAVPDEAARALARALTEAQRPLLVAGPWLGQAPREAERQAVEALSARAGAPLFAEPTSGFRFGTRTSGATVLGALDACWRAPSFAAGAVPDLIIELGLPPVSSSYAAWLGAHAAVPRWVVAPWGWGDPVGGAQVMCMAAPGALAARVADLLPAGLAAPRSSWCERLAGAEARAWKEVDRALSSAWQEGAVARTLVESLPAGAVLVVGNSNPVRDLDTYCPPREEALTVLHQRGASGIDGLVAGACGAKSVHAGPVALFLGDVSLAHDLSSLALAREADGPLLIVVVQNQGGRIFEQLPLGRRAELHEAIDALFVTAPGHALDRAAALFGLDFARVESADQLRASLADGLARRAKLLIEAVVPPRAGTPARAALWREVGAALSSAEGAR